MFTGIVEEMGTLKAIRKGPHSAVLEIQAKVVLEDIHLGDSIAVNGVCLTATSYSPTGFTADVMHETLNRSALATLRPGSRVNLERAMAANGRFGGHIVAGHVDGWAPCSGSPGMTMPSGDDPSPPGRRFSGTWWRRLHHHRRHQPHRGQGGQPILRHLCHSPHRVRHRAGRPEGGRPCQPRNRHHRKVPWKNSSPPLRSPPRPPPVSPKNS